ncbi:hypothetical protein TpMuguga_04g02510 [Theileria parva strain Muguga]|uniref:uncharacterized protein n=1 Tax=Theileria parva strain Muguga TaxID=333668 RepID=UPI001C61D970|nr:uncharacterized protein TpMuguga_04g02510 [Theileria parva strain Muguga]KAF5153243.1 hypothetical protein TpMuguga_04g02510 [Theileria parva strain Muguga]
MLKLSKFSLSRANTAKIAQYVDRVIYLGKRNLLFRVNITHLYSIWNMCKTEKDYKYALTAVNHFYNFGRQLTPEAIDKLFVTTLRCNQLDEAIELIHGASDWLIRPPSLSLIYLLLGELMSKGDFDRVFRLYKIIRTSWKIPLTSTLYNYLIKFMLNNGEYPVEDSLLVYGDSDVMEVNLPEETHVLLMESLLRLWKDKPEMCKSTCLYIIKRLVNEAFWPRYKSNVRWKTYYVMSWFMYRFQDQKISIPGICQHTGDWRTLLEYSLNSALMSSEVPIFCEEFVTELGTQLESLKFFNKS